MYKGKYADPSTASPAPRKKSIAGTIIFYVFYVLLILAFVVGISYAMNILRDWLVRFEASQPNYKCEEVFTDLFSDPDWEKIYELSDTEDTTFENSAAYEAYMTQKVGDRKLTYLETSAGLSGGKKYIVRLDDEKIATFTLRSGT